MSKWEFLILTVMYGDGNEIKSVRCNGKQIFSQEPLSVLLRYTDDLKSKGWQLAKVTPKEWGEIQNFKQIKISL